MTSYVPKTKCVGCGALFTPTSKPAPQKEYCTPPPTLDDDLEPTEYCQCDEEEEQAEAELAAKLK